MATPRLRVGLMLLLPLLSGCRLPEDEWGIVRVIFNDFPWWSVVWRLIAWTVLGAFVGIGVGLLGSLLLRRWGAYRLPWPRVAFWLRAVIITLNIVAIPFLFGTIGFFEGVFSSGRVALHESVIGKEWLPEIALHGADAIAMLDAMVEQEDVNLDRWDDTHRKKQAVNVPRMLARLDKLQAGMADRIGQKAKEKLFEEHPDWRNGASEAVIDWTLPPLINYLLNRKLQGKLAEYGVPDVLAELRAEAIKDGDDLLTHDELVRFLRHRVLIPMLLYPLREWVRGSQWATLGIVVLWFAMPVLLMWITRWINFWWKRRQLRRRCVDML